MPGKKTKTPSHYFRTWHRRLGLASCLFLVLLALTGVLINHAHQIGLDKRGVQITWLLDYYGIGQPRNIIQFAQDPSTLTGIDNQLWLGERLLLEASSPVLSALWFKTQIIAIDANQLYIFDQLGQLLETQNASTGLTPRLIRLSTTTDGELLLTTQQGLLLGEQQLLDWRNVKQPNQQIQSSKPQIAQASPKLLNLARSKHLSWERVILDLHSGRVFGAWAVWLWDFVALVILILSLSGIWMWRHKKSRR